MGLLIGSDGKPPRRFTSRLYCGRCLEELERTSRGALVCPNECPP